MPYRFVVLLSSTAIAVIFAALGRHLHGQVERHFETELASNASRLHSVYAIQNEMLAQRTEALAYSIAANTEIQHLLDEGGKAVRAEGGGAGGEQAGGELFEGRQGFQPFVGDHRDIGNAGKAASEPGFHLLIDKGNDGGGRGEVFGQFVGRQPRNDRHYPAIRQIQRVYFLHSCGGCSCIRGYGDNTGARLAVMRRAGCISARRRL